MDICGIIAVSFFLRNEVFQKEINPSSDKPPTRASCHVRIGGALAPIKSYRIYRTVLSILIPMLQRYQFHCNDIHRYLSLDHK